MKKNTLLLWTALVFAVQLLPAQTLLLPLLQDSSHYRYFDPSTGAVQTIGSSYYNYDSENLPLTDYFVYNFGAGSMNSYYRYDYEYNAEKLLTNSTSLNSQVSITGPWGNWLKTDYTYDTEGRNNYYLSQLGEGSGWKNYFQETFWFDDAAPSDSSLYQLWNTSTPAWDNYRRSFNYYFPVGDLKRHHEDEWKTASAAWNSLNQDDYTYYPDGKVLTIKSLTYNANQVSLMETDSFLYRADGKIDSSFYYNFNTNFNTTNRFATKYLYDVDGNLIEKTAVKQVGNTNTWVPSSRQSFLPGDGYYSNDYSLESQAIYDAGTQIFNVIWQYIREYTALPNGQVLYREEYQQKDNQGMLAPQSIDSVWYHLSTVNTHTIADANKLDCKFANPFVAGRSITCDAPDQQSMISLRISNIYGQLVAQARVLSGESWTPSADWSAGTYFLTAWQNGTFLGERKMVVIR